MSMFIGLGGLLFHDSGRSCWVVHLEVTMWQGHKDFMLFHLQKKRTMTPLCPTSDERICVGQNTEAACVAQGS